jgi:transposase
LRKKVALMQTVIGIGPISAMVVLAYLPDISQLTKGQAARLAGLAPINNDEAGGTPRRSWSHSHTTCALILTLAEGAVAQIL